MRNTQRLTCNANICFVDHNGFYVEGRIFKNPDGSDGGLVASNSFIGKDVIILEGTIVGPGATIGDGTIISERVEVMPGAIVEPGSLIPPGVVVRAPR